VIVLEGDRLDERGMLLDFGDIKRVVSRWVDDTLDHRMLLCRDDPVVPLLRKMGEPMLLLETNPTAENIAKLIFDYAKQQGFPVVEVRLWETPNCSATYCPDGSDVPIIQAESIAADAASVTYPSREEER
jgi:6-pyruvoyltetrahydropterin/6-carboxytetrahydropterin synthase